MKPFPISIFCLFIFSRLASQDLYFPPNFSDEWETMEFSELDWCDDTIENLNSFLESTNTNAFMILKDGKIAHEAYFNDFDLNSSWYWASAGKTLTASLIGILQEEGSLAIEDPTSMYLGDGWTSCSPEEEMQITLRHQLTMTTGLDFTTGDIYCTDPECLQYLNPPGEEWYYHNAPYTLLADVMEAAAEQGYTGITNEKLTNKIGFIGLWTNVNTGRLFFSTIRGMARFGLLMLNNGDWDGDEVIKDKEYLNDMINSSQDINPAYGYLWWLNGKETYRLPGSLIDFQGKLIPNAPDDLYAAIGKNGQILMVVPSENLIIARMGNNPEVSLVPITYVQDLWNEYEKLTCSTSTFVQDKPEVSIRPNLVFHQAKIHSNVPFSNVVVYNQMGEKVMETSSNKLIMNGFPRGVYFIEIFHGDQRTIERIYKL